MRLTNSTTTDLYSFKCKSTVLSALLTIMTTACSTDGESVFSSIDESAAGASINAPVSPALPAQGTESMENSTTVEITPQQESQLSGRENLTGAENVVGENDVQNETSLDVACDAPELKSAILTLTNNARAQSRRCGAINFSAAEPLTWDNRLEAAALSHNNDMVDNNFFDHTGSNGLSVSERISAQGFDWSAVGENIAAGQRSTASAINDWLSSPGHCRNIMSGDYTSMALACRVDSGTDYGVYWTAVYAR